MDVKQKSLAVCEKFSHQRILVEDMNILFELFVKFLNEPHKTYSIQQVWFGLWKLSDKVLKLAQPSASIQFAPKQVSLQTNNAIKGIVLVRIAAFVHEIAFFSKNTIFPIMRIVSDYIKALQEMDRLYSCGELKNLEFYLPQILNGSLSLIDSYESANRCCDYTSPFQPYYPTKSEKSIFEEANKVFKKSCSSYAVIESFQIVISTNPEEYSIPKDNLPDIIYQYSHEMKIHFVQNAKFWGMVALDGIFIDKDVFSIDKEHNLVVTWILSILLHEFFHYVMRRRHDDCCWTTPRIKNQAIISDDQIDGGFMIEQLIFGTFQRKYYKAPEVMLNLQNWKRRPIFTEEQLKCMEVNHIENPQNSGLLSKVRRKARM